MSKTLAEDEDFSCSIYRTKFEELCIDLFRKYIIKVEQILNDADKEIPSSRSHSVWLFQLNLLGSDYAFRLTQRKDSHQIQKPDEAVAYGNTYKATILNNENQRLFRTSNFSMSHPFHKLSRLLTLSRLFLFPATLPSH